MADPSRAPTQSDQRKLVAGLAVQPFLAAAVAFVSFPLLLVRRSGETVYASSNAAGSMAFSVGLVVFILAASLGLPVSLWLMKRGPVSLTRSLLIGLILANLPILPGYIFAGTNDVAAPLLRSLTFSSLIGLIGSATLWLIAFRRPSDHVE